jgi:hypothetical protein
VRFILLNLDPIYIVNLILCILIVFLGIFIYFRKGDHFSIYVGISFGLFGVSHAVTIFGLKEADNFLIVIRLLAYLVIIYALFKILRARI